MDRSNPIEDTIKTWTDAQIRLVDGVGKAMLRLATPPSADPYEFSLDLWEKGVRNYLAMQDDWASLWLRSLAAASGKSDQPGEQLQRLREMARLTSEFQDKFWEAWFTALKRLDPIKNAGWRDEFRPLAESW